MTADSADVGPGAEQSDKIRGNDSLRLFVHNSPGAVAMFDREMRYLAASKRFAEHMGIPGGDLRGRSHYDVFPDMPDSWRAAHQRCLAGATERAEADPFPRANGTIDWVTWEIQPWYEATGEIGGIVLFSEVITERVHATNALRKNEARFRTIFEHAPIGVAEWNVSQGRILRANEKLAEFLGRSSSELETMQFGEITHPDDVQLDRELVQSLRDRTRKSYTREKRYLRPSGEIRWGRVTVTTLDVPGETVLGVATVEDITDRRAADALVRLQTTALQAAANGIVLAGRDGRVEWVNDAYTAMTGYAAADVLGQRMPILQTEKGDQIWAAISSGQVWHGELDKRRKDGTVYPEEQTVTPVRDENGTVTHFVAIKKDISERRRTEQALRDNLATLQTALDGLPTPIALSTAEGRCLFINRAYREVFGYTIEDHPTIDRSMELFYPDPDLRARLFVQWAEDRAVSARTGETTPIRILPMTCKDGRVRQVRFISYPLDGYLLAILDDVTDQRSAAAALVEADERQRLALDAADLATWRYDFGTGLFELDARAQALLALPAVAPFEDVAHRLGSIGVTAQAFEDHVEAGVGHKIKRLHLPDGSERWISMQTKTLFDDTATPPRPTIATVVAHDITDERIAAEALRQSEERYRTLVDSLDDVIFSLDDQGRLTFVNAAVRAYGYDPEQCIGRPFDEFIHPEDRDRAREINRRRLAGEPGEAVEYRVLDATNKTRNVRIVMRPAPGGGLAGVAADVTKMHETEAQLRAAQKMEAVGRLAGGIAHDFNNLLSVILSYADFCTTSLHAEDPLRKDLAEITAAGNRATSLTRQLLAFSRRQVLQPERVEVGELVSSIGRMLTRVIGEDIELVLVPSRSSCLTMVDRGQLEQVVMNLVVNARDAMPDGGRLTVSSDEVVLDDGMAAPLDVPPGRYVRLAVIDTGTGMDEETRSRVFEPFFTTKALGKGTGLGLSTVYGIVKQSRGGIAVDSIPGIGSTFAVYLPAVDVAETSVSRPLATISARGHETLLVVEDEAALRSVVVRVLRRAGYRVLVAALPSEALVLASEHGAAIALVLTDVVMPEMNGRELAGRLAPMCPNARILYTSGYTDDALVRSGVLGEEFLPKPFNPTILTGRIRSLLDARSVDPGRRAGHAEVVDRVE